MNFRTLRPAHWVGFALTGASVFVMAVKLPLWIQKAEAQDMNMNDVCNEARELETQLNAAQQGEDATGMQMFQMMHQRLNELKKKCAMQGPHQDPNNPPPTPIGGTHSTGGHKAGLVIERYHLKGEERLQQAFAIPPGGSYKSDIIRRLDAIIEVRSDRVGVNATGNMIYAQSDVIQRVPDGLGHMCEARLSTPSGMSHKADFNITRGDVPNTLDVFASDARANDIPFNGTAHCNGASLKDTSMTSDTVIINGLPIKEGGHVEHVSHPNPNTTITTSATLERVTDFRQ